MELHRVGGLTDGVLGSDVIRGAPMHVILGESVVGRKSSAANLGFVPLQLLVLERDFDRVAVVGDGAALRSAVVVGEDERVVIDLRASFARKVDGRLFLLLTFAAPRIRT